MSRPSLDLLAVPFLLLAATPLLAQQPVRSGTAPPVHHLVQIEVDTPVALARLLRLGLDIAGSTPIELGGRRFDVIATDTDVATLRRSRIDFRIAIRNLEEYHRAAAARFGPFPLDDLTPPVGQGAMGGHYTLAQMEAILDAFARDHPAVCAPKVSIGKSIEGRDLWMVKISDNVARQEGEPQAWFDALHHAREPLSMTTTLLFMDRLLSGYGTDPELTYLVNERELFFVPCVNPDGYDYNRRTNPGGGGMWRKNRRDNGDGTFGVDLNRNYATGWSAPYGGNSTSTSAGDYRGTAPFSEPETAAVEAFVRAHSFTLTNSCHSYSSVLMHPWGYQSADPPNVAEYRQIAALLTARNGIPFGNWVAMLGYIGAGNALDHHHAANGTMSWSPELGRSDEGGFWPAPPKQVEIATRNQHMFQQMALVAGPNVDIGGIAVTEAPGGNGNGKVEPGETGHVVVTATNDGLLAASGSVVLRLFAVSSGLSLLNAQASIASPPRLGQGSNAGNPLSFSIPTAFPDPVVRLQVTLAAAGRTRDRSITLPLADPRPLVGDDFELDRGFARAAGGTATDGLWERGVPEQTLNQGQPFQLGTQHTTGGRSCWVTDWRAGSSVGANDVDGGFTDLVSPELDLSHLAFAELRVWRVYAESVGDDAFQIAVSRDGGQSWATVLDDSSSTGGWVEHTVEIDGTLTDRMRLRFRAQDLNASLVEAMIDDVEIRGIAPDGSITLLSSGAIGTVAHVGISGRPAATGHVLAAPKLGPPLTIPGVGGQLLLDPALIYNTPPLRLDSRGYAAIDLPIPNDPALRGGRFHFQGLQIAGSAWQLANAQTLTFR